MKKINLYIASAAVAVLSTACTHEDILVGGEGKLILNPSVSTDMKVVSRSVEQDLIDSCMIWISNEKGLVRRYDLYSELPTEPIDLVTGHYVAEAWTGDSVPASWDSRWFKGMEEFDITAGETTTVDLVCSIANVGATVKYAEGIEDVFSNFSMTVGHKGGSLVFEGRENRRGYFMMPSFDKNLAYELRGTQIDGSEFIYTGVVENAKPGYEYAFNVKYTQESTEVGGGTFSIEIEENEIEVRNDIQLVPAPKIVGYGFDINTPVMGEQGAIGRQTVYVTSATKVTEIELTSELFETLIPAISGKNFELLGMNEVGQKAVADAGITYKYNYNEAEDETLVQINFESQLTNSLDDGEYSIDFRVLDKLGKTATATLHIIISNAPIITAPAQSNTISYFSATLRGTATSQDVEKVGFNYRKLNDSQWNHVDGQFTNGLEFTAEISNLEANTTYEYVATSDNFVSSVTERFTTRQTQQLPNSGFEDWYYYNNKTWVPGLDYTNNYFWDSGNHGGSLVNKNFTTRNSNYKHSGEYSACLKSEKVMIQFAAGNIFAGKYLGTDGTNGILGWGRPFTETPKSVNIWVKYNPVNVTDGGSHIKKGDLDEGIIYIALVDNSVSSSYNGTTWPCVVKTKTAELFDKDGSNVIAYGERIFTQATEGDDLILINIPLEYFKQGVQPSSIIFVASASRYGDYFEGGSGSTMYLDDIELVY